MTEQSSSSRFPDLQEDSPNRQRRQNIINTDAEFFNRLDSNQLTVLGNLQDDLNRKKRQQPEGFRPLKEILRHPFIRTLD